MKEEETTTIQITKKTKEKLLQFSKKFLGKKESFDSVVDSAIYLSEYNFLFKENLKKSNLDQKIIQEVEEDVFGELNNTEEFMLKKDLEKKLKEHENEINKINERIKEFEILQKYFKKKQQTA